MVSPTEESASSPRGVRGWLTHHHLVPPLFAQVIIGLVLGVVLGLTAPGISEHTKVIGDAFIRLVQMIIIPLLFPLIVLSIAKMDSAKAMGRLAAKSLLYFEVVTTVILVITVSLAVLTRLGKGADIHSAATGNTGTVQKSLPLQNIFLDIIPSNIVSALSTGNLLAMLFFATFFGLALSRIGAQARPVIDFLDGVAGAMFQVTSWVVKFAPLAVISFVAYNAAHYGWQLLVKLAIFVVVFYAGAFVVLFVIFPLVALFFRVPYFPMLQAIGDLLLLGFVTRSSEVVLAPLVKRLEEFGVGSQVASFTLPLGYTFNADGATMYEGFAVVFIANAYGIELTIPRLITTMLVLMLLTKGFAGVPSSSIVILFSASAAIGLPAEGVAILLAVDFVVDMARTAINIAGNGLACVVVAKSEGTFGQQPVRTTPTGEESTTPPTRVELAAGR